jgi:hypothetical protein
MSICACRQYLLLPLARRLRTVGLGRERVRWGRLVTVTITVIITVSTTVTVTTASSSSILHQHPTLPPTLDQVLHGSLL